MQPTLFGQDICAGRHLGNAESQAANARIEPHKGTLRARALEYIREQGQDGTTVEEAT